MRRLLTLEDHIGGTLHECPYCGEDDPGEMVVDHIIPTSKGGSNKKENRRLICRRCNALKSDRMPEEFDEWMRKNRPKMTSTGVPAD